MQKNSLRERPSVDSLVPLDGNFVHMVEGVPVKELNDEQLADYQQKFAVQSQPLIEQQAAAMTALVRNEVILNVLTYEINRRRTALAVPH